MDANLTRRFENRPIRTAWNADEEEWYFSVVDVVGALTESADPKQYVKKLRARDPELDSKWGTICTPVKMVASDGKRRNTSAATAKGLLRIIQSIPSRKAEPFKMWLAQVGAERIEETIDPELTINRALEAYARLGYSEDWINQRLLSIRARKELTDQWKTHGIQKGGEFAILTDEVTRAWSGMSTRQYKNLKGLSKENLRDNMNTLELTLNMLAEVATTEITKVEDPYGIEENKVTANKGGSIAGDARRQIEAVTGRPAITSASAPQLNAVVTDTILAVAETVLPSASE